MLLVSFHKPLCVTLDLTRPEIVAPGPTSANVVSCGHIIVVELVALRRSYIGPCIRHSLNRLASPAMTESASLDERCTDCQKLIHI